MLYERFENISTAFPNSSIHISSVQCSWSFNPKLKNEILIMLKNYSPSKTKSDEM